MRVLLEELFASFKLTKSYINILQLTNSFFAYNGTL